MTVQKKEKKMYLEVLRLICIFFVMFNHTAPTGYLAFIGESNIILYYLYMFCSVLCKIAVPIFFMISGSLLLSKTEPIRVILKKRVLVMTVILLLVSIPNYLWAANDHSPSIIGYFRTIYTGTASSALWYLYAYIGFLLMLPFLRAMAGRMKEKDFIYLFWLRLLITVSLTMIDRFAFKEGHNSFILAAVVLDMNIFYPLMGHYAEHMTDKKRASGKNYLIAAALSTAAIIVTCIVSQAYYGVSQTSLSNSDYESCFEILICVPAICVFYIAKGIVTIKPDSRTGRIIIQLGGSVFGLYLIENVCRTAASPVYKFLYPYLGGFLSSIAMVLAGMALGLGAVCLLKNIPGLKKIVNKFI